MICPSSKRDSARRHRVRWEHALRATANAALVLFLLLSPTFVRAQATVPDNPSGPAPEQQSQQLVRTGDSATQPDGGTEPKPQLAAAAPAPDPSAIEPKTASSQRDQPNPLHCSFPHFPAP